MHMYADLYLKKTKHELYHDEMKCNSYEVVTKIATMKH